jgi:ABC-type multidrug transport system ATPase subunit
MFNGFKAVDKASFNVRTGEIFGFLGPNGAGKTTTLKAMLGLLHQNAGIVKINGFDMRTMSIKARQYIGYLPERVSFYENLTPVQTLSFFCELKLVDKSIIGSLLKEVGLEDAVHKKVGTFSKGMVQLLGIAQAMIGDPSIYILDEPMSGLDARWVKVVRDKIKLLNEKGATILFSSHILSEVQTLCDRVAIIDKGKMIAEDTVANLSSLLHIKPRLEITIPGLNGQVPEFLQTMEGVEAVQAKDDRLFVTCKAEIRIQVVTALKDAGFNVQDFTTVEPSLEEAFVKLIAQGEGGS